MTYAEIIQRKHPKVPFRYKNNGAKYEEISHFEGEMPTKEELDQWYAENKTAIQTAAQEKTKLVMLKTLDNVIDFLNDLIIQNNLKISVENQAKFDELKALKDKYKK